MHKRRFSWIAVAIFSIVVLGYSVYSAGLIDRFPAAESVASDVGDFVQPKLGDDLDSLELETREYREGDCIWFGQTVDDAQSQRPKVVACTEPHVMEYVGEVFASGDSARYPTDDEWDTFFADKCTGPVEAFLGYPVDPDGVLHVSGTKPLEASWQDGARDVECGVVRKVMDWGVDLSLWPETTNSAKGLDQQWLWGAGTCVRGDEALAGIVTCDQAHDFEVVGQVTVAGASRPTTDDQWWSAVGSTCDQLLTGAGKKLDSGGYLEIPESSWDLGARTAECVAFTETPA